MSVDDEETISQPLLVRGPKEALQNGHPQATPVRVTSTDAEQSLPLLEDEPSSSGWPSLADICAVGDKDAGWTCALHSSCPLMTLQLRVPTTRAHCIHCH